jgi:hypothetical protein
MVDWKLPLKIMTPQQKRNFRRDFRVGRVPNKQLCDALDHDSDDDCPLEEREIIHTFDNSKVKWDKDRRTSGQDNVVSSGGDAGAIVSPVVISLDEDDGGDDDGDLSSGSFSDESSGESDGEAGARVDGSFYDDSNDGVR